MDFGGSQRVQDLPGPDGKISLAEAGLASDNTPGVQTIGFAVPQSEWEYQWLFPGRVVFRPFLGFRVFQTAILDGTTQTAFTGDTYPDGAEVVNSTIRGPVAIGRDTRIVDSFIGPFSAIGDGCEVVNSEIEHSVVMNHSKVLQIPRLEDSLIGHEAVIERTSKRPRALRLMIGDHCQVDVE